MTLGVDVDATYEARSVRPFLFFSSSYRLRLQNVRPHSILTAPFCIFFAVGMDGRANGRQLRQAGRPASADRRVCEREQEDRQGRRMSLFWVSAQRATRETFPERAFLSPSTFLVNVRSGRRCGPPRTRATKNA